MDAIWMTHQKEAPGSITLRVEGQIIGESVATLEREVDTLLGEYERVLLDLALVTYVSSSGLRLLQRFREQGGALVRCAPLIRDLLGNGPDGTPQSRDIS